MQSRAISGWLAGAVILGLLIIAGGLLLAAEQATADRLHVSFLDVGQGDAVLIQTPSGNQVLIDGGQPGRANRPLSAALPFYDRSLDVVIGTHADSDHVGGLVRVLREYEVNQIVRPAAAAQTPAWQAYKAAVKTARTEGATLSSLQRGDVLHLGDGAYLLTLFPLADAAPADANASSLVLKLIYGETSWLLTGDSPQVIEEYLAETSGELLNADVLKVGHHGSDTSSARLFLSAVSPQTAVISAGADNSYGHPHQAVLDRLAGLGIEALCTCEEGTITFTSNGREIRRIHPPTN